MVVLPTYNEAENLQPMVECVLGHGPHVLVVDDGSPDGTGDIADGLVLDYPDRVAVIHRSGKLGLGTAYVAGFKQALTQGYDCILEMDCDFQHDPAYLPLLLDGIRSADLVLGSRYVPGGGTPNWSLVRRVISRGGSIYSQVLLGLPYHDLTGGFKCFRREVLAALDLDTVKSNGYAFQVELTNRAHRRGFRIVEVPIVFGERRKGTSKMSADIVLEAAVKVWRLRWNAG